MNTPFKGEKYLSSNDNQEQKFENTEDKIDNLIKDWKSKWVSPGRGPMGPRKLRERLDMVQPGDEEEWEAYDSLVEFCVDFCREESKGGNAENALSIISSQLKGNLIKAEAQNDFLKKIILKILESNN